MSQPADYSRSQQTTSADAQVVISEALVMHRRWLQTVLLARGIAKPELDDVMQEISIAALLNASRLRDRQKVAPWLYRIAVTAALQFRRRMGRKRRLAERFAEEQTTSAANAEPDPLGWLLADEQQQLVRQAIEHLPSRDAEILLLKHTEDWSYRQLAEHLGISESAIDARLHRARGKLRRALTRLVPDLLSGVGK